MGLFSWFNDLEDGDAPDFLVDLSGWRQDRRNFRRYPMHCDFDKPGCGSLLCCVFLCGLLSCAVMTSPFKTNKAKTQNEQEPKTEKVIQKQETKDKNTAYIRFYRNTRTR